MSSILNTNGTELEVPALIDVNKFRCAIFTAEWNTDVTHALRDGAIDTLHKAGVDDSHIFRYSVPGTVELVNAAAMAMKHMPDLKAIIIIGCVIRGDTPHFDYVCKIVADGTASLNAKGDAPVIFGVLTTENLRQAQERAGGKLGNKGAEAAVAAIEMANLHTQAAGLRYVSFRD